MQYICKGYYESWILYVPPFFFCELLVGRLRPKYKINLDNNIKQVLDSLIFDGMDFCEFY